MIVASSLLFIFFKFVKKYGLAAIFKWNLKGFLAGLFLAINYYGYMKGIEMTNASHAQVMIQLAPTFLILIGIFYFKETPSRSQLLGMAIAALGFFLFYKNQLENSFGNQNSYLIGNLWIFAAAISWAIFSSLQKVAGQANLHLFNFFVYTVAAFILLPGAQISPLLGLSLGQFLVLLFLGFNTVVAYGFLGEAFKRAPASQVSLIIIINPLITISLFQIMSYFDMSFVSPEVMTLSSLGGALLVVAGVGVAVFKK